MRKYLTLFNLTVFSITFLCCSVFSVAQTVITREQSTGELAENLWYAHEVQWEEAVFKAVVASKTEFQQFLDYNRIVFFKDRGTFFSGVSEGRITKDNAAEFFNALKNDYVSHYNTFLKIKKTDPAAIDAGIKAWRTAPPQTNNACNPSCNNMGFQNGTLSGWSAFYGVDASTSSTITINGKTGGVCGSVTQAAGPNPNTGNNYHVSLMSGGGADPIAGAMIPFTPPLGGISARVGDGPQNGYGVGILEQTYVVSAANPILTIQYAVVLENPQGHPGFEQPWFQMEVLDQNGVPVPGCGQYFVSAGGNKAGFKGVWYAPNGDTVYCRSWTTAFVPLYNYVGQCVTVRFTASDCSRGGHFGYAYVAASCTKLELLTSSAVFCTGQKSATITGPPGAASYSWTTPNGCISGSSTQQILKVTCAGTYKLVTTASAGASCVDTFSVTIPLSPAGPPPVPCFKADTVCAGSLTHFNATCSTPTGSGVKYYWDFYNSGQYQDSSGTTPTWTYSTGGTFQVRLHMQDGPCSSDTIITIKVDPRDLNSIPKATYVPTDATTCSACNGKVQIKITLPNPMYPLTITNTCNSCVISWNSFGSPSYSGCGGSSSYINNNGNVTITLNNLLYCPGDCYFIVKPATPLAPSKCSPGGGVADTSLVPIGQGGVKITSTLNTSPATCGNNNGTASITAFGGASPYTYSWSGGLGTGQSVSGLAPGTYTVNITDANGCKGKATVTIQSFPQQTASVIPYYVSCFGANDGAIKITPTGGTAPYTYSWMPNISTKDSAGGLAPGTYSVTITDAGGCTGMISAQINQPNELRDSISSSVNNVACGLTGSATVGVKGGYPPYAYKWSNGPTTAKDTGLVAGTYTVTVTDGNGCKATASITIQVNCGPAIVVNSASLCKGACTTLSATGSSGTGPYSYSWNTGATTQTISVCANSNTSYTVTATDANGLKATALATVIANTVSGIISNTTHNPCTGDNKGTSTALGSGGNGPYTYAWSTAPVQTGQMATGLTAGTYSVTVRDVNGCTGVQTVTITEPPPATEVPVAYYCTGDSIAWLYAPKGNINYQWFDDTKSPILGATDDSLIIFNPLMGTIYYVQYTDPLTGCTIEGQVIITDNPNPNTLIGNPALWASNVFTPNGDGKNDFFELNFPKLSEVHLEVYDRWGLRVFETEKVGKGTGWDGKFNSKEAPEGVYYWIINYNLRCTSDNSVQSNHGFVHLFRSKH